MGVDAPHTRPSRWQRQPAVSRYVDDGIIVAPPDPSVEPVVLTGPGGLIWELLADPLTLDDLTSTLGRHFGGETDMLVTDVVGLIEQLGDRGLIAVVPS